MRRRGAASRRYRGERNSRRAFFLEKASRHLRPFLPRRPFEPGTEQPKPNLEMSRQVEALRGRNRIRLLRVIRLASQDRRVGVLERLWRAAGSLIGTMDSPESQTQPAAYLGKIAAFGSEPEEFGGVDLSGRSRHQSSACRFGRKRFLGQAVLLGKRLDSGHGFLSKIRRRICPLVWTVFGQFALGTSKMASKHRTLNEESMI